ncbi:discoidin domain-containing protein [Paenibacillus piscarius]|uniref:discoidin domain-containing protein n=1 Tax=Paenibacillus piscarius TaxID=1089681 RepID=UPI001EE8DECF|nr:discoidin domain-containing protein [Paenibacillus piscarius]
MPKPFKIIISSLSVMLVIAILSSIITPLSTSAEESSAPKNLIPIMTSNDAPTGHATASSVWVSGDGVAHHQPFRLFDGDLTDVGWSTSQGNTSGWVAYEFDRPVVVNQYALMSRPWIEQADFKGESPKDFTFDAWDGKNWITLNSEMNITDWKPNVKKAFSFTNENPYTKYRLNIINNNGLSGFTALGEMEMYRTVTATPEPTALPTPSPTPTPDTSSGDRALLTIELTTGAEKEYDLPISEVNTFLTWYDSANGSARFGINKHDNNKGPFSKRTEYVIHDKILTFEVSEYTAQ